MEKELQKKLEYFCYYTMDKAEEMQNLPLYMQAAKLAVTHNIDVPYIDFKDNRFWIDWER